MTHDDLCTAPGLAGTGDHPLPEGYEISIGTARLDCERVHH